MYKNNKFPHSFGRNRFTRFSGKKSFRSKSFDPSFLVDKNEVVEEVEIKYEVSSLFEDFNIDSRIKEAISRRNFTKPTPIQDKAIPEIINGKDLVGIADTGTGKTAAFLIPLIDKVFKKRSKILIVAPTRELATQIESELREFNKQIPSAVCIGGLSITNQKHKLRKNPNFVIGTPGRLMDLFNQKALNFNIFDTVVLDEVDRMLDMGFIKDVQKIIQALPTERQSLFFSATLDEKTKLVMNSFLKEPTTISLKSENKHKNIEQKIVKVNGRNKEDMLQELLDSKETIKSLVFVRTKRGADKLNKSMLSIGFRTAVIHGNKSQFQRQKSLELFKLGKIDILIATDVASRGIDVKEITHVINFDLPETQEDYIHRIGRTGRGDKKGIAVTFV